MMLRGGGGGGVVVNLASISGLRASTQRAAHGPSKAALIYQTRQLAEERGNPWFRVNAVAPGPIAQPSGVGSAVTRSRLADSIRSSVG
jgi:meso-butanediol dehydrogenase/(S,S)-butanediol dehydrogenase/diacetyl reductase